MKKISFFRSFLTLAAIVGLIVVASTAAEAATTSSAKLSLVAPVSGSFAMGQTQTVKWSSTNYKAPVVSIRLIRKVSSNPARYEVVRTISAATKNDGVATWVPASSDIGTNLSLEIGCATSGVACQAGNSTGSALAVTKSTRYSNTASAFQAIEAKNNK